LFPPISPALQSTLFPYTTLFRSSGRGSPSNRESFTQARAVVKPSRDSDRVIFRTDGDARPLSHHARRQSPPARRSDRNNINTKRSEEHTSELQSRSDLVCRLLLE